MSAALTVLVDAFVATMALLLRSPPPAGVVEVGELGVQLLGVRPQVGDYYTWSLVL
jgi:hypothetical protein